MINFKLVDIVIRITIYSSILFISSMLLKPMLKPFKRNFGYNRFRQIKKSKPRSNSKLYKHIKLLISTTLNSSSDSTVLVFCISSISLFCIPLIVLTNNSTNSLSQSIIISLFFSISPYIFLQIRLYNIRINSSYEGESLVIELSNQYKINYLNMNEAIDKTIRSLNDKPYTKRILGRMSWKLKTHNNEEELNEIIKEFVFSIDTQWAMLLANNMFLAIQYDDDVREALDDIIEDFRDLKKITERNKQKNYETYFLTKYMSPLMYAVSVFSFFKFFGFNITKYIDYQFRSPLGLRTFTTCIITIILNFGIYFFTRKPKYDF